jgi:hypothetical protein
LADKVALRNAKKLEESMSSGIASTSAKMNRSETAQSAGLTIEDKIRSADKMMEKLLEEEKQNNFLQKVKKQKVKNKGKIKNKKTDKNFNLIKTATTCVKKTVSTLQEEPASSASAWEDKATKFTLKLFENSFKCVEDERVQRWKTTKPDVIRQFVDNTARGNRVQHYRNFNDEQIHEQRVRHYLPGPERLLKDPSYRSIYAFPTDRGYGFVAQLSYNEMAHNGILFIGMDKAHIVFHKYFEEVDFNNVARNVFQDNEPVNFQEVSESKSEEWAKKLDYDLDISKEGILHYRYSDHDIRIYPLNKELFEQKLANMQ